MKAGRSIGAVFAGMIAGIVLSIGTDMGLRAAGLFPPFGQPMSDGLYLLATVYRGVYSVACGYLTARLAPDRPMRHALILGAIALFANLAGLLSTWDKGPDFGPKWYPMALVILAVPCAWAGAKLVK